jgi:GntR family transcriptional regulator, rspAB operon transcriptional repressor
LPIDDKGHCNMESSLRLKDPIAPQLIAVLRQAIAELQLQPGEALSEKELAARFGISRQPVREAFIKLAEHGLVEVRPSRGTFVMKISVREVADARFVREAIECSITASATRLATPAETAGLRALLGEQQEAAAARDARRFNDADVAFHRAIVDIVQSDYASRVVEGARIQADRVRYLSLADGTKPLSRLIDQHAAVVERMEAGDAEGAERAMRRHLREILLTLPRIAARHPHLFSDTELPEHSIGLVPQD